MSIQDELPRSRINLKYRTTIDGVPRELELPLRLLVLGDFSLGASEDRKTGLENRRIRSLDGGNIDSIMSDMKMRVSFQVPNRIDSNLDEVLNVDLPIGDRKSFSPVKVAQNVPQLRALLMMRRLLVEAMSNIDNRRALRRLIQETYQSPEALQAARDALAAYVGYRLPTPSAKLPSPQAAQLPGEGGEPTA